MLWKNYGKAMEFLFWGSVRTLELFAKEQFSTNLGGFCNLYCVFISFIFTLVN